MPKPLVVTVTVLAGLIAFSTGMCYSPSYPFKPNFRVIYSFQDCQEAFIDFMVPKINYANAEILETRSQIQSLMTTYQTTGHISASNRIWLRGVADVYQVSPFSVKNSESVDELLSRVDIVPTSLVLAQSANESGWGTSLFAVEADNFFGQHCHVAGCGMVPRSRPDGATYEAQRFPNVQAAISEYIYNLNTNPAYSGLRDMRAELRKKDEPLLGIRLVPFLSKYSILGERYSMRISSIIANHDFMQYDKLQDTVINQ